MILLLWRLPAMLTRLLLLLSLGFSSAAFSQEPAPPTPQVVGAVPLPGEPFTGRFVVFFDQPVAATAADALVIDPPLEGAREAKENYLSFRASGEVNPTAIYSFSLQQPLPASSWQVTASPVAMSSVSVVEENNSAWTFGLRFSRAMNAATATAAVSVVDAAGNAVPWSLASNSEVNWNIKVPRPQQMPLTIRVSNAAADATGKLTLLAPYETQFPSSEPLALARAEALSEDGQRKLRLTFSNPVLQQRLYETLKVYGIEGEEPLDYYIDTSDEQAEHAVVVNGTPSGGGFRVVIDQALIAGLYQLAAPIEQTLPLGEEPLTMQWHDWTMSGVEAMELRMEFNQKLKADEVKAHLRFEPAVEVSQVESDGWNQITITGNFNSQQTYSMILETGLKDDAGNVLLDEPLTLGLNETPDYGASEFAYAGKLYFPKRSAGPLEVKSRNVEETKVTLYQVFPNNIVPSMDYIEAGQASWEINDKLAKEVATQTLTFPKDKNIVHRAAIDMGALVGELKGVFSLNLSSSYDYYSSKIVVWTNIGLLSHWTDKELVLYAHDLFTLEPIPGAMVTVYSRKNQQLSQVQTDAQGIARLSGFDTALGQPHLAVVESGEDYSFIELEQRYDDPTTFTSEMPQFIDSGYDGYIYADRNLYRPGETVHLRYIVRTHTGSAAAGVPLKLKVTNPRGVEVFSGVTTLSDFGTGGSDWSTGADFLTGRYNVELAVPDSSTSVAQYTLNLEEFVPNRIEANLEVPEGPWRIGQDYPLTLTAKHLFGAPAEERKAEMRVLVEKGSFAPSGWEGFSFGNDAELEMETISLGDATTDAEGKATFTFNLQSQPKYTTPIALTIRGDAYELGGRGVSARTTQTLLPAETLLGAAAAMSGDKQSLEVQAAAVTPEGAPAALAQVEVTLEKQTWSYHVRRFEGYNEPRWSTSWEKVGAQTVALAEGRGAAAFPIGDYGYYRVRVSSPETTHYSTVQFYRYWHEIEVVESARPSLLKLSLAKESYNVGEQVELRIESPFDGKAVVVLQGAKFHQVLTTDIKQSVGSVSFAAPAEYFPNVWAEVTVAHDAAPGKPQLYPYSSFGTINVPVHDPSRELGVSFQDLFADMRPASDLHVQINVRDHAGAPVEAEVTLAAVDDGVHAIMDYETPDPAEYFARPRQPDFRRAHYYDKVAYDFTPAQIGGDAIHKRLGKGHPEIDENWIKPVALWSGVVRTDASGRATVVLPVPEFNGRLRLVAVATTAHATGATESPVLVRRPYMLRTTMPRFALPGDQFTASGVVFNTTAMPGGVRVKWQGSGALSGAGEQALSLEPNSDVRMSASFTAAASSAPGAIDWTLETLDASGNVLEQYTQHAALPVRPPTTYRSESELVVLQPGETREFKNALFLEDDQTELRLTVSATPALRLRDAFEYLLAYPYGCLEQTVSRCLPLYLVYASNLHGAVNPKQTTIEHVVQGGIDRLLSYQTGDGGLAMWSGGTESYAYGSTYALHFLTIVQQDGRFRVQQEPVDALKAYVRRVLEEAHDDTMPGLYRRAYAAYVLALAGDLGAIEQIQRFDNLSIPKAARYLLAAALAINTGDIPRVQEYLASRPVVEFNERDRDDTLNSAVRNTAVETLALLTFDPQGEEVRKRVELLMRYVEQRQYTTQEAAFVASALALYLRQTMPDASQASAQITGTADAHDFKGDQILELEQLGAAKSITVANTGQAPLFVYFTTAGIPLQSETGPSANGLAVTRALLSEMGEPVDAAALTHGGSYIVDVMLKLDLAVENVVLADRLPAGFEVVNPRLEEDALAGVELPDMRTPSFLDVRDDRLVAAFDALGAGEHHLYYIVRAVTPGTFVYPPARAECMYDPMIAGNTAPGSVTVGVPESMP